MFSNCKLKIMKALCIIVFLCEISVYTYVAAGSVCPKPLPANSATIENEKEVYQAGEQALYSCPPGYLMRSSSSCSLTGKWSPPTVWCEPRSCTFPGQLQNGDIQFTDLKFQSTIHFSCHTGYILKGASSIECLHNGSWSERPPVCEHVKCRYPEGIKNGFLGFAPRRDYNYQDTLSYVCYEHFTLDGPREIKCEKTGMWSLKPSCKASCIISVRRGRIFYHGSKIWLEDLPDRRVQHNDTLYFYCKDKDRKCGYPVLTQCLDGNINTPSCFEEPSALTYTLRRSSLPSETKQC